MKFKYKRPVQVLILILIVSYLLLVVYFDIPFKSSIRSIFGSYGSCTSSFFINNDDTYTNSSSQIQVKASSLSISTIQNLEITTKGKFSFVRIKQALDETQLQSSFNICLATQTTIDRVSTITKLASYWAGGPIELVIFLRDFIEIYIIQYFMTYLATCQFSSHSEYDVDDVQWFIRTVSVQIAFKTESFSDDDLKLVAELGKIDWTLPPMSNKNQSMPPVLDKGCYNFTKNHGKVPWSPEDYFKSLLDEYLPRGANPALVYSQNHMRNAAKHACAKHYDWVTVLDVDIVPKMDSAAALQQFYRSKESQKCEKCAFVFPVYEIAKPCHYPITKSELTLMSRNSSLAVPFHFNYWKPPQEATNYNKWNRTHLHEGPIQISHPSTYKLSITSLTNPARHKTYFYEPFYISHTSIPDYEERFEGFGFTRSSQTFSALVAGWKFKILTPSFVIHCGIQHKIKSQFIKTRRYHQVRINSKKYNSFVDEKLTEYKLRQQEKLKPTTS